MLALALVARRRLRRVEPSLGRVVGAIGAGVLALSGDGIKAGEFDEFEVSAGPLPSVETMTFKALQTYADGEVVRWIEEAAPGGAEPEHPAPVPRVAKATPASETPTPAATSSETEDGTTGTIALALAAVALVGAAVAIVLALRAKRVAVPTT